MSQIPNCFYRVSVKALVLNETKDKFLLCKEEGGRWELPGGGLDWDITPQEDLPRELMEEMGLKAVYIANNPSYFITGRSTNHPEIRIANVLYETKLEHLNFTPSDECIEIRFVNKDDVEGMELFDGPKKLLGMFDPANHQ
ncbi:MAG: NUDIX hydrolase [Candidatus Pacebacteria bacterium]|nr:NUDIX hydrolase [Candidatus Paceibacterota bacterium]